MNNSIENLEWCTVAENNSHAWETGLKVGLPKFNQRKLNKETVDSIRSLANTMMQKDIAAKFNIGFRMVSKIINNTNIYIKW